jgi:hypothetical protein
MSSTALRQRRRTTGHARRTRPALRRRVGRRLPSPGRILALVLLVTLAAAGAALAAGPWLRVERVAHVGERYTPAATLDEILDAYRGRSTLAIDSRAIAERLRGLPTVAAAEVNVLLPGELRVTIAEKSPAFTWLTSAVRLVGAADGTLIGELPRDAELPADLAALPTVDDRRRHSRLLTVGDVLPPDELDMARRLVDVDPALLGSTSSQLSVRVDAEFGFILVSAQPSWQAALGFNGLDPGGEDVDAAARLEQQLAAIRTLFATRPETSVRWVDARNPGKVYWAP